MRCCDALLIEVLSSEDSDKRGVGVLDPNAITNPLYGLTVGSVAFGEDARKCFGARIWGHSSC
jgi:hypothetical protein